jgi:hypothetical protein
MLAPESGESIHHDNTPLSQTFTITLKTEMGQTYADVFMKLMINFIKCRSTQFYFIKYKVQTKLINIF